MLDRRGALAAAAIVVRGMAAIRRGIDVFSARVLLQPAASETAASAFVDAAAAAAAGLRRFRHARASATAPNAAIGT